MNDRIEAFKEDNPHLIVNDSLKEQFLEDELYQRIFELKDKIYTLEDEYDELIQKMIHTNITLGEVEKIFKDKTIFYKYGKDLMRILNTEERFNYEKDRILYES